MAQVSSQGSPVVITGGSGGIGREIAKKFAENGATVILVARNKRRLADAQKEVGRIGQCFTYSVSVDNEAGVKKIVGQIAKKFKRIDVLVNGAGILGPVGEFHTNTLKAWKEVVGINLGGTANMVHAVLPYMIKQRRGKIVNFSGGGAVQPFPNVSGYAASKAAVVRFTENLAREYEKYNIQANAIAPGAINTTFLKNMIKAGPKRLGDYYQKALAQKKSGGDSPVLAAELVYFLCSDACHNLTGKLISAKWDPWKTFTRELVEKLNQNSEYALRRIDNQFFREISHER